VVSAPRTSSAAAPDEPLPLQLDLGEGDRGPLEVTGVFGDELAEVRGALAAGAVPGVLPGRLRRVTLILEVLP
jgi:hypothetical protein